MFSFQEQKAKLSTFNRLIFISCIITFKFKIVKKLIGQKKENTNIHFREIQ